MHKFSGFTLNGTTYINEKITYKTGEILTCFLNYNIEDLEELYDHILAELPRVLFPSHQHNKKIARMQTHLTAIDKIIATLPPYNKIGYTNQYENRLIDLSEDALRLLNEEEKPGESYIMGPPSHEQIKEELSSHDFDKNATELINEYLNFCDAILRIHYTFKPFLDAYIHTGSTPPNQQKIADSFEEFSKKRKLNSKSYMRLIGTGDLHITHEVVTIKNSPILCEIREYSDISSFLYDELMQGLKTGLLPKKCHNCGKYFLLENGYYPDFCERKAPNEIDKTCRDIGAKKKFDDKVKSDPIWLTYQRAYKTHYARLMKKKMTQDEFEHWSSTAIELREKALLEEIKYDDYYIQIRK